MSKVLCSVSTRGRYFTTLPLTLQAIINQTKKVDKLIIFDDNDDPQDMRNELVYSYFFQMLDIKKIDWEWRFAEKKGQHFNHQVANTMGFEWVWRVDDDALPEPNVLERLFMYTSDDVGAVGGSILTPPLGGYFESSGLIEDIDKEPNIQWSEIRMMKNVEHLHCSFLYRAGICDYNLKLSRVAHREETLFTYALHKKGYNIIVVPGATTWHLKNPDGGIRSETKKELYHHDEQIFRNFIREKDKNIIVLNCGMGDHIIFSKILPEIENADVYSCYPEIVPGKSIAEAEQLFGDLDQWNIYKKMDQWNWKSNLENAFRKMYL